jgi:hypothetical protein
MSTPSEQQGVGVASIPARTWRFSEAADIANRQLCSDVCIRQPRGRWKSGIRRQRPPISSEASGAASAACGAPKSLIVTGSARSSTGAENCTSSASAERVSRKSRTVDLGGSKAGSWGCVGVDPALVPHAAALLGMGSPTEPRRRSRETRLLRAVPRWRIGVTHTAGRAGRAII